MWNLTHMVIEALFGDFTITKYWKQAKCPSTGKWINQLAHLYNGLLFYNKNKQLETPQKHYAEKNKLDWKGDILSNSITMTFSKENYKDRE